MANISTGDVVRVSIPGGESAYLVVDFASQGILLCHPADSRTWDEPIPVPVSQAELVPRITLTHAEAKALFLYQPEGIARMNGTYPYRRVWAKTVYQATAEDFLAVLDAIQQAGPAVAQQQWITPTAATKERVWAFKPMDALFSPEMYPHLPDETELLEDIFDDLCDVWDADGIAPLKARVEAVIALRHVPVPERVYEPYVMQAFIEDLFDDDAINDANPSEAALYAHYVNALCEADNPTALRARAYGAYGGNLAMPCDWTLSRDTLLRLMTVDGDAGIANTLGYIYYYGRCTDGVPDYDQAFYYYSIGAAGGHPEARYKLSDMFVHGYGVPKNNSIAYTLVMNLYRDLLPVFLRGEADSSFPDVALRAGLVYRDGIDCEPDMNVAYSFLMQAQYAIRERMRVADYYGDKRVASNIKDAIDSVASHVAQASYGDDVVCDGSIAPIVRYALIMGVRVQAAFVRTEVGIYRITFTLLPLDDGDDDSDLPRIFMCVPDISLCRFVNSVTVDMTKQYFLTIDGEPFTGDNAKVIFDSVDDDGVTCRLRGQKVMRLGGLFTLIDTGDNDDRLFTLVTVVFDDFGRRYDYLWDGGDVKPGDQVSVLTDRGRVNVTVVDTYVSAADKLALPLERYKHAFPPDADIDEL